MIALIFWPAGTFKWVEGWVYFVLQMGYSVFSALYFLKHNPSMIETRMEMKFPPKLWDKIIMFPMVIAMIALLIVPGLDVRYGWSSIPLILEIMGFIGFVISMYMIFLVMKVNSFLLKTVEIQKNHTVVSTGPYRYVRHPMYIAAIIMCFSLALALGSVYSLIPAAIASLMLIIRTQFEDNMLQRELKGYNAYTQKTKYKLIPGVW